MLRPFSLTLLLSSALVLMLASCAATSTGAATPTHAARTPDPELPASAYELNITVFPPSTALDFSTPATLVYSAFQAKQHASDVRSSTKSAPAHEVGHTLVELRRGGAPPIFAAVSDEDDDEEDRRVFDDGVGFALLFEGVKGHIQSERDVRGTLRQPRFFGARAARLRVLLSREMAEHLALFFERFEKSRIAERFALAADPLTGTGAGCASFAIAFLEAGDLMIPEWRGFNTPDGWRLRLRVPEALIGGATTGRRIDPYALIAAPIAQRWAEPREPGRELVFYETGLMHAWLVRAVESADVRARFGLRLGPEERTIADLVNIPTVTLDRREARPPAAPRWRFE